MNFWTDFLLPLAGLTLLIVLLSWLAESLMEKFLPTPLTEHNALEQWVSLGDLTELDPPMAIMEPDVPDPDNPFDLPIVDPAPVGRDWHGKDTLGDKRRHLTPDQLRRFLLSSPTPYPGDPIHDRSHSSPA